MRKNTNILEQGAPLENRLPDSFIQEKNLVK